MNIFLISKICLKNIPFYKRAKILRRENCWFLRTAITKNINLKRQETGNNQLSQIFFKTWLMRKPGGPLISIRSVSFLIGQVYSIWRGKKNLHAVLLSKFVTVCIPLLPEENRAHATRSAILSDCSFNPGAKLPLLVTLKKWSSFTPTIYNLDGPPRDCRVK